MRKGGGKLIIREGGKTEVIKYPQPQDMDILKGWASDSDEEKKDIKHSDKKRDADVVGDDDASTAAGSTKAGSTAATWSASTRSVTLPQVPEAVDIQQDDGGNDRSDMETERGSERVSTHRSSCTASKGVKQKKLDRFHDYNKEKAMEAGKPFVWEDHGQSYKMSKKERQARAKTALTPLALNTKPDIFIETVPSDDIEAWNAVKEQADKYKFSLEEIMDLSAERDRSWLQLQCFHNPEGR